MNKTIKMIVIFGIVVLIALAAGFMAYYFYSKYQNIKKNPNVVAQEESEVLVEKISKLIELPKNETPTIATVLDKTKLKDQAFFKNSENGDKVLLYMTAKKAFLYRPSTNKVVDVAPVFSEDSNATK